MAVEFLDKPYIATQYGVGQVKLKSIGDNKISVGIGDSEW